MRKLITAALLLGSASFAHAADAVVEDVIIAAPDFTWTGFYLGLNAGYSWGDFDQTATLAPYASGPLSFGGFSGDYEADADGASGGAQAGYNWQVDRFVFGFEADIQAANIESNVTGSEILEVETPGVPVNLATTVSSQTEVEWFGTARLRAGFAPTERLLVYGTGGFAFGRTKSTSSLTGVIDPGGFLQTTILDNETATSSDTRTGWAAGAGAEFAIDGNWSVKGEYLYTDLGDEEIFSYADEVFGAPVSAGLSSDVRFHTVRIGLNYRF